MTDDPNKSRITARSDGSPTSPSRSEIDAFLAEFKKERAASATRGRLIFALDATASRQPTWDWACQIQAEMFQEAAALGGLDIQLAYYRGFGEFKASPWLGDSRELTRRMTGVRCLGGGTARARGGGHTLSS